MLYPAKILNLADPFHDHCLFGERWCVIYKIILPSQGLSDWSYWDSSRLVFKQQTHNHISHGAQQNYQLHTWCFYALHTTTAILGLFALALSIFWAGVRESTLPIIFDGWHYLRRNPSMGQEISSATVLAQNHVMRGLFWTPLDKVGREEATSRCTRPLQRRCVHTTWPAVSLRLFKSVAKSNKALPSIL